MNRSRRWSLLRTALIGSALLAGCHHTRRGEMVPPERPYLATPSSASAMGAPSVGFSAEPASNAFSGATAVPPGTEPTPGFGTQGATPSPFGSGGTVPGVMGEPGAPPSPL